MPTEQEIIEKTRKIAEVIKKVLQDLGEKDIGLPPDLDGVFILFSNEKGQYSRGQFGWIQADLLLQAIKDLPDGAIKTRDTGDIPYAL